MRFRGVAALARALLQAPEASRMTTALRCPGGAAASTTWGARGWAGSVPASQQLWGRSFADKAVKPSGNESELQKADAGAFDQDFEHATGIERYEMELLKRGFDPFDEEWRYNDKDGDSEQNPIVVPCATDSRIIGIVDPDDDATIWWRELRVGDGPVQIIENSKWFVLQKTDQLPDDFHDDHH